MMNLLFVKSADALASPFIIHYRNLGYHIIPIMPKAALAMAATGYQDIRLPIGHLKKEQRETIFNEAIDLSKRWYQRFKKQIYFNRVDLMECCRLQMLAFFQDLLVSEIAVTEMIRHFHPETVIFPSIPRNCSFNKEVHNGRADIFEAVGQHRFREAGVQVTILENQHGYVEKSESHINLVSGATESNVGRMAYGAAINQGPIVVGYGGDHDIYIIWPYIEAIAKKIGAFPLMINQYPSLQGQVIHSGIVPQGGIRYIFQGDIPIEDELPDTIVQTKKDCIYSLSKGDTLPEILRNPLLEFQFENLFKVFIAGAVKSLRRAERFFCDHRVMFYLDDFNAGHLQRAWCMAARNQGVRNATVTHAAGVNLIEFFDFVADYAFTWGELAALNMAIIQPEKKNRIITTGSPLKENFKVRKKNHASEKKTVLLVTGGFLQQTWTDFSLDRFIRTWDQLFKGMHARPETTFLIKPHPSDRDVGYWYEKKAYETGLCNLKFPGKIKIETLIDEMFLTVLVGKPGTAAYVSMINHVPAIYLDTLLCRETIGYAIWKEVMPCCHSVEALFDLIDGLVVDKVAYQALSDENIKAAERIVSVFNPDMLLLKACN